MPHTNKVLHFIENSKALRAHRSTTESMKKLLAIFSVKHLTQHTSKNLLHGRFQRSALQQLEVSATDSQLVLKAPHDPREEPIHRAKLQTWKRLHKAFQSSRCFRIIRELLQNRIRELPCRFPGKSQRHDSFGIGFQLSNHPNNTISQLVGFP